MKPLTPRQYAALAFVVRHIARYLSPPDYQQVGGALRVSWECARQTLLRLESKGYIALKFGKAASATVIATHVLILPRKIDGRETFL